MPDIIRWLLEQPLVLLLLIAWIFSSLGGLMQRAARRAQRDATPTTGERPSGQPPRVERPRPQRRDAEEIAREIRRAMGLERPEAPSPRPRVPPPLEKPVVRSAPVQRPRVVRDEARPRPVVDYDEAPRRAVVSYDELPQRPVVVFDGSAPRETLREHMAAADLARKAADALHEVPGARRRRGPSMLDLSRPAAALLAAEVLGPPLALRPHPFPREPRDQ